MMPDKKTQLYLIETYPEFLLNVMTFSANHVISQLGKDNLLKKVNGKIPNKAACHPFILQQFRRNIDLELDISNSVGN